MENFADIFVDIFDDISGDRSVVITTRLLAPLTGVKHVIILVICYVF
jgi:hypothetical protein